MCADVFILHQLNAEQNPQHVYSIYLGEFVCDFMNVHDACDPCLLFSKCSLDNRTRLRRATGKKQESREQIRKHRVN